jgi:hypothetical protein
LANVTPSQPGSTLQLPASGTISCYARGCCGASDLLPAARGASYTSSVARVHLPHLHPFTAPASSTSWHFLHAQFPEQWPPLAGAFNAMTSAQLSWLPTKVRRTLVAANHAQRARLWSADRGQPSFTVPPPAPAACGDLLSRTQHPGETNRPSKGRGCRWMHCARCSEARYRHFGAGQ